MEREERGKDMVPASRSQIRKHEENIEIIGTYHDSREEIDPYAYLQVVWRHRRISFIFFFVVVVVALVVSFRTKPMYLAHSTVEVATQKPQVVSFQDVLELNTQDPVSFNTQLKLLQSRAMAEAVISEHKLWGHPDFKIFQPNLDPISILSSFAMDVVYTIVKPVRLIFAEPEDNDEGISTTNVNTKNNKGTDVADEADRRNDEGISTTNVNTKNNKGTDVADEADRKKVEEADRKKAERDDMIDVFLSRTQIETSEDSRLITIGFMAYDPKFAAKMADAIADTFVEWTLNRRLEATRKARQFLKRQIAEVKADLEDAEGSLQQFLVENDIVGLDENMNLIYRQLQELQNSLAATVTEKTVKRSLYESVGSGNPDVILDVMNDPLVQQLRSEYNQLLIEYTNLRTLYKPEYPQLKRLQARIEEVRARLNEATKRRVEAIKSDYEIASQKEKLLKERFEEQEELAVALNKKTVKYRGMEREVQTTMSIYDSMLRRLKETEVTMGIESSGIQVLDHASTPKAPFNLNIPRNLMLALAVGLIGAVGIAFIREFFDRTIKTSEEIREKMRLPVLGGVLKLRENKHYNKLDAPIEKLYLSDPRSPFSEAIYTLRTSIMLSSQDHSLRSILVTSCWPGEGKTTIATNLALSLAYDKNKVLLIEADLRHPSVGKLFGIDRSKPGLSNYLVSNSKLNEIVHSTQIPQLFVLPSGSINPSRPSRLLQSGGMKQLLGRLRSEFDYIIMDSSPVISFADSLMLSTFSEGTVLVASAGITMQKDIAHVVKQLSDVNARFLGVVVNRLEVGRDASLHGRYYRGYYDGMSTTDGVIEIEKDVDLSQPHGEYEEKFDEADKLKDTPYPDLLLSFHRSKRTGVLDIDSELKLKIYLQDGFPVFVEGGDDSTLLGSIAVAEGRIQSQDLKTVLNSVSRTKRRIGEALIGMGFISHHELDLLLEYQTGERLIRGFECSSGTYSFKAVSNSVESITTYKINPLYVIYEGVKRFGDIREIEKKFFTTEAVEAGEIIIALQAEFEEKLKDMSFISPKELRFLRFLGEKKLRELKDILSIGMLGRADVLKFLYFLNLVGFIEIKMKEPKSER